MTRIDDIRFPSEMPMPSEEPHPLPPPATSRSPDQPGHSQPTEPPPQPAPAELDPAQLRSAMKAFKKRLKMSRLDDESRLGRGPLSGGGRSGIVSIEPPAQFPRAVWDELARQGKLRRAGQGMYELADEH
jgi:hypothetical protein